MQHKDYDGFPIDSSKFQYYLSEEQLASISFTCDDSEFYEIFGGGPDMSEFENQVDQPVSDAEERIPLSSPFQEEGNLSMD